MGARLINWALDNRFLVLMLLVLLIVFGGVALVRLPIDAVPDVTNVQVQIMTTAPALAAASWDCRNARSPGAPLAQPWA